MGNFKVEFVEGFQLKTKINNSVIKCDQPADSGGKGEFPTPAELFLASVPMCVGTYAAFFYRRENLEMTGFSIDVSYDMAEKGKRRFESIRMTINAPNIPENMRKKFESYVNSCVVGVSIHDSVSLLKIFNYASGVRSLK